MSFSWIRRHRTGAALVTLGPFLWSSLVPAVAIAQTASEESAPVAVAPDLVLPPSIAEDTANDVADDTTLERAPGDPSLPSTDDTAEPPGTATIDPGLATTSPVDPSTVDTPADPPTTTLALPTGADKSGVTSKAISVPTGAGTIKGMDESFSAQLSTGIATFSVPFALPSARGKAQPSLGLSYSSAGGFGVAGTGWSVGAPFIARQTDRGVPSYDDRGLFHPNQDRFVFNGGQELVPICVVGAGLSCPGAIPASAVDPPDPVTGTQLVPEGEVMPDWSQGWMYFRPRVEGSFLRFFFSPDKRTWRVQSKSGVTMELGVPLNETSYEEGLERNPDNLDEIYRWCITRQYDTYGNANPASGTPTPSNVVAYRYFQEGGMAYLSDIFDTPPAQGAETAPLEDYAHHTRLAYEPRTDPTSSYRSGWRIEQNLRLERVDVTSKTFAVMDPARRMVRRYHLEYDADYHASLLTSVQVEGRCSGGSEEAAHQEDGFQTLPEVTSCPRLPPMTFGYSHVEPFKVDGSPGTADLPGYEGFDERVRTMASSPPHSVDDELADLFDINSDGLPDVLVTAPGLFAGKHGAFINGAGGDADSFTQGSIAVAGVLGADAGTIQLKNLNVVPLDLDADATINLLHMPKVKTYSIYTPVEAAAGNGLDFVWQGRVIDTASGQSPKIDFGNDTLETKVVDVNFDGLVDVVVSTGQELQTFFSLGRYPEGDGQFGSATWTGPDSSNVLNDPVTACVPWSSTPVRFSDPDIKLADMNGDGIVDIVRVRRGNIQYWPGRGNGFWGTGKRDDCPSGTFGQDRHIPMTQSPYYSDIQETTLRLDDVNGDGLTDLVQVRFQDVDVWLNVDGRSWTDRHIIEDTPASPSYANRVRLVDVNGSGTRDVLWGDGDNYRYMDLQGGKTPRLLTFVDNGLGKTTDIEYGTSTEEMLAAEQTNPWTKKMPTVIQVVKRVTESDNITVAGKPPGVYVTEYTYRDPVFEGRQREFRGFSSAEVRRIGDSNSPTDITTSHFLLGECIDEDTREACPVETRWRDNPREALKGLPFLTEKSDENGTVLSTEHMGYRLRQLYVGLDGRVVRHAFESTMQRFLYDTGPFMPARGPPAQPVKATVELEATLGTVTDDVPAAFEIEATAGTARVDMEYVVDAFGNRTNAIALGCVGEAACPQPDEVITTTTQPGRPGGDPTGWLWRTARSFVTGSAPDHVAQPPRYDTTIVYNDQGDPLTTHAMLAGSEPLQRSIPDGLPSTASTDTLIPVSSRGYDGLGNLTQELAPNGRCRTISYDGAFEHLPIEESIATGGDPAAGFEPANCTTRTLVTQASYDRSFELVAQATDMQGQPTVIAYDDFGRLASLHRPNPHGPGLSPEPSVQVAYFLPGHPALGPNARHSIIHTQAQDGEDVSDGLSYLESWTYVDGLGRTIVTLNEADPTTGPGQGNDDGARIASGLVDYDNKSAVRRKFLEFFTDADPLAFNFAAQPGSPYGRQRYDAFGRQLQTFDLDGTVTLQSRYHALSTDLSDAADLQPGPHQGTFASERRDGHGRTVAVTERFDDDGGMEQRVVRTAYLHTNEPEVITRERLDSAGLPKGDPPVIRWLRYDSVGRMVLNVEPNTSGTTFDPDHTLADTSGITAWRYAYNDFGDLVGTSDARGCGVTYEYDGAGRLLIEDYSPCEPTHAPYSDPEPASRTGIEVSLPLRRAADACVAAGAVWAEQSRPRGADRCHVHPAVLKTAAWWRCGTAARTPSRATTAAGGSCRRAVRIAKPVTPGTAENDLATRYTPRWYQRDFEYDAADRETLATTGATDTDLVGAAVTGQDGVTTYSSAVTTTYSRRGTVSSVKWLVLEPRRIGRP